ncbi:hypothetical protein C8R46DRAFT_1037003 [Mycena filopes]|nr:hypothetical protein C8R46DRAFT_1037003 [Mycena filopes]
MAEEKPLLSKSTFDEGDDFKMVTKMADYFEALYADDEENSTTGEEEENHDLEGLDPNNDLPLGVLRAPPSLLRLVHLPDAVTASPAKRTPAPSRRCANPSCRSESTSRGWYSSTLLDGKVCNACQRYEREHHKHRPAKHSPTAAAARPSRCANPNCGSTKSSKDWYNSILLDGEVVCDACRQYEKRHGEHRPLSLTRRGLRKKGQN